MAMSAAGMRQEVAAAAAALERVATAALEHAAAAAV